MPKSEHEVAIKAHLASKRVGNAISTFALKAGAGTLAVSYWVTFLLTVMLPMLPSLLQQAAPKIMANTKLIAVLRATRNVINGILGDA